MNTWIFGLAPWFKSILATFPNLPFAAACKGVSPYTFIELLQITMLLSILLETQSMRNSTARSQPLEEKSCSSELPSESHIWKINLISYILQIQSGMRFSLHRPLLAFQILTLLTEFGEAPAFINSDEKYSGSWIWLWILVSSDSCNFSSAYHIGGKPCASLISSRYLSAFFNSNSNIEVLEFLILKCRGVL